MLTGHVPFDGESAGEILMKHLTTPPDLSRVQGQFRPILDKALSKNPAHRYRSMAEMSRDVLALESGAHPITVPLPAPAFPGTAIPEAPSLKPYVPSKPGGEPIPVVLPVTLSPRQILAELSGSMAMAAVLALLLCIVWAAILQTNNLTKIAPYFFLTLAASWAVILPAKLWTTRMDDFWRRRVALMCVGVGIGVLALWLEGYELPSLFAQEARADQVPANTVSARPAEGTRSWYNGGLLVRGQDVPVAACYLAYFGLSFFVVRWWKMADRRRSHRFSFYAVFMAALC